MADPIDPTWKKKVFTRKGPNAVDEVQDEVNKWWDDVDDDIQVQEIQEFEDEDEGGKVAIVVIYYTDIIPSS